MKRLLVAKGVLISLGLGLAAQAVADEPPAWGRWAAVAFTRQNGGYIGRAHSERSELVAKETAIRACHDTDCEIKTYVERGCIGIAKGYEVHPRPLTWWGFGAAQYISMTGSTVEDIKESVRIRAGEAAKVACDSASHNLNCNVIETYCTWESGQGPSTEQAITEWINEHGGESSREIRNTLQLCNVAAQAYLINVGLTFTQASCVSGTRWASVKRAATRCRLGIEELERLYASANQYGE